MNQQLGELKGPLLIFGGPYSNLAATLAIKGIATKLGLPAQQVICTGDVVAYCAEPKETVDTIIDWGCHVVMGNCEESLAQGSPDCGCGFDENSACSLLSVEWYRYASKHVSDAQKTWMGALPREISFSLNGKSFSVIHGSTESINEFVFASSDMDRKSSQLFKNGVDVIIGGHCGIPFGQQLDQGAWLNAGVIGMPANDATADGWYMLLSPEGEHIKVSWHRLNYDVNATVSAMNREGICEPYAKCLSNGLWPSTDILPEAELHAPKMIQPVTLIL